LFPATATGVSEGKVPSGAIQGRTDAGRTGYTGPCPPPGSGVHHYTFTVYALRVERIELNPSNVSAAHIIRTFDGEAIARATAIFGYDQ
jgi:Raf kinase inhibitor-like YbhB/YbcL family protein